MVGISSRHWGYIAVALAAGFFALVAIFTKLAYGIGMTPLQLLTLQSLIASGILGVYGLLFRPAVLRIEREMVPKLMVQSLIGSLGTSYLISYALLYLPASLAIMLLFTYPVLVTLGAYIFLKEKIRSQHILALALALGGTVLSTQFWRVATDTVEFVGIIFGLGSGAAYAFFNVYGEHILHKIEPLTTLTYVQVFSSIGLLIFQLPEYLRGETGWTVGGSELLLGLALATVASIIPFWLLLEGIKRIGATKASIIGTLELPITFILAFILLQERFSTWQFAGGILIIASVFIVRLSDIVAKRKAKVL